jgi:transcriptional regulator with XRE-family HTH domain
MPNSEQDRVRLGELLRQAREYLELSQDEVAKQMSLPRTAISLVESGQRRVEALELKKFAEIYQRPVAFFTGEQEISAALPDDVEHLARTAKRLSDRDREELARFAEFLSARASGGRSGNEQ